MKNIKYQVWHDITGKIIAVGHAVTQEKVTHGVIPKCSYDQQVVEIEIEEKLVPHLHSTHVVDIKKGLLIAKNQAGC